MSSNDNKGGLLTFYWISEGEHGKQNGKQTLALGTKFLGTNHYLYGAMWALTVYFPIFDEIIYPRK